MTTVRQALVNACLIGSLWKFLLNFHISTFLTLFGVFGVHTYCRRFFNIFEWGKWLAYVTLPHQTIHQKTRVVLIVELTKAKYSAANFCFSNGLCMTWNKVTLSEDKSCQKSCHDLGFQSPNRYETDLLKEVQVGQEATKISEVKVGGWKKSARSRPQVYQS